MRWMQIAAVVGIALMLTSCATTTGEMTGQPSDSSSTTTADKTSGQPSETTSTTTAPVLSEEIAIEYCASRLTYTVFDGPAVELGTPYSDSFGDHYNTSDARASIVDGEWYIEFPPATEDIATLTCHTDGADVVAMTRAEFERAMDGRTYDGYVEVTN